MEIDQTLIISHLRLSNQELLIDNRLLVQEVNRLRALVAFYTQREAKQRESDNLHMNTVEAVHIRAE